MKRAAPRDLAPITELDALDVAMPQPDVGDVLFAEHLIAVGLSPADAAVAVALLRATSKDLQ